MFKKLFAKKAKCPACGKNERYQIFKYGGLRYWRFECGFDMVV